jgi:filamentous hemagglutinin
MQLQDSDYYKSASQATKDSLDKQGALYISKQPVTVSVDTATYQNATNGMMNDEADAILGALQRTKSGADGNTLNEINVNYNPTHGILGDAFESGVDKFGLGTTGIAKQTGEFKRETTTARGTDGSNFTNHSQAALLDAAGTEYINRLAEKDTSLGFKDRDYFIDNSLDTREKQKRGIPTTGNYGAAQNNDSAKDIIEGMDRDKFKLIGTATHTGDMVSEWIGQNPSNSNLDTEEYGDTSPHSNYVCADLKDAKCGGRAW